MSASEREKIKSLKTGTMQSYVVCEAIESKVGISLIMDEQ